METRKEMRMYEVETTKKELSKLLKGKQEKDYARILAEVALEDTDPEPCNKGQKSDVYFQDGNIGTLAYVCLPVEAEFEVDEDGDYIADVGCDYPEDVFSHSQLWELARDLFGVTEWMLDDIALYMDDEIREKVHNELAPCDPWEFLNRYCEIDPSFEKVLNDEFSIYF